MQSLFWLPSLETEETTAPPAHLVQKQDEMSTQAESHSAEIQNSSSDPVSLEGQLQVRKGRSSGHSSWVWKRRFVIFNFENGGSVSIYREDDSKHATTAQHPTSVLRTVYSRLQHRSHSRPSRDASKANGNLVSFINSDLPWIAKDVEKDPTTFVVEISTANGGEEGMSLSSSRNDKGFANDDMAYYSDEDDNDDHLSMDDGVEARSLDRKSMGTDGLIEDLGSARASGKPLRIYFRCDVSSNEKALWLKAFSKCGRLSTDVRKKKSIFTSLTSTMHLGSSRTRSIANEQIARDARHLDLSDARVDPNTAVLTNHVEYLARGKRTGKDKEFRVLPSYAYPHRWLSKDEMREEMVLPSEHFHDLRVPGCKEKEIGSLQVEVLQCLGLPKLDRVSDSDSVVYLVCGSYAFSTDVIYNRTNPMWLRKTRRACEFPLFHGYARLYAGVFDDESRRVKDDFAGRVVIDLARLRPRSTYDVTLPLRLSTHVYSKRKRGALRLRFTLNWHTERDALLSYLPKTLRIPLPQHSTPNYETTVMCSDQKAFRNIAITVHGAHLPGRFTFNQMRAAIREINFTRKYVFTALRQNFRDIRQWQNPAMSAFIFLAWMHCIYLNAFSLVPAYAMLYFLLLLMRNYAKYGADGPCLRGFTPPSWEELFMALIRGGDPDYHAIEPLELGARPLSLSRGRSPESILHSGYDFDDVSQYKVKTHKPKGTWLLRALGFLPEGSRDPNDDHLEFPFADGKEYPRFTVKESLVTPGQKSFRKPNGSGSHDENGSAAMSNITDEDDHRSRVMPRFPIDMDLHRMMRKDSSGTRDYDEEEDNFATSRAVISQGKFRIAASMSFRCIQKRVILIFCLALAGRKAASKMTKTATALSTKTGLDYVVKPIHYGISSGVSHVSSGVGHVSSVAGSMTSHMMHRTGYGIDSHSAAENDGGGRVESSARQRRRGSNEIRPDLHSDAGPVHVAARQRSRGSNELRFDFYNSYPEYLPQDGSETSAFGLPDGSMPSEFDASVEDDTGIFDVANESAYEEIDPVLAFPEQNIDIQGPSTGKKLTDDLAEIKDKMHELTWHLFDDHTYVIKNPESLFFGESTKPTKRQTSDPSKKLDKYLHMGQYSHSNPFVARVGMYVEPIIGSSYSILCLFRAGFNVVTWRDPMLTFWLSFFCGVLSIILFFFPWRMFLFLVGVLLVGPQNWLVRILREKGRLPPAPTYSSKRNDDKTGKDESYREIPTDKPVFTTDCRKMGNGPRKPVDPSVDPREIHHVVVPYSALYHQRCNDWPPEPQYAQVKRKTGFDDARQSLAGTIQLRRQLSGSEISGAGPGGNRNRGRLRRRMQRDKGLPPIGPSRGSRRPTTMELARSSTE